MVFLGLFGPVGCKDMSGTFDVIWFLDKVDDGKRVEGAADTK